MKKGGAVSEQVAILVPKSLIPHFLILAEWASDKMGDAGCNDYEMEDTPDNRELIDMVLAKNLKMTLEEYRSSDKYVEHHVYPGNKLLTNDYSIFELFVSAVKSSEQNLDSLLSDMREADQK